MFEGNAKGPLFAANEQQELRATPQKCHVALLGNHGLPCGQDAGSKFLTCKAYKLALCCAFLNKSEVVTNTNPKVPRGTFGKKHPRRAPFSAIALAQPPRRQLNTLPCSRVCSPANRYEFRATRLLQDSQKCKHFFFNLASGRCPLRTPASKLLRVRYSLLAFGAAAYE